jgi:alkylation response protein AidB-like acyl-CoA dehydrogenase
MPRWTNQRIVFGKPLHAQAVIRAKLASMISRVESGQNWLESITYQMNNVSSASLTGTLMAHYIFIVDDIYSDVK